MFLFVVSGDYLRYPGDVHRLGQRRLFTRAVPFAISTIALLGMLAVGLTAGLRLAQLNVYRR